MKLLRDLYAYPEKRQFVFILAACAILIVASVISALIFLWLNDGSIPIISMIIISDFISILLMAIPIMIVAYRYTRPREKLKKGIKNIGSGRFNNPIDLTKEKMYTDIAASLNEAGTMLNDKIQSILAHTARLSAIEEELSASLRTDRLSDGHTKALICQLKICASRMRNDLNEFSLENSRSSKLSSEKQNQIQSSISV
jgi:methyl-accepting chemotaxis protein